MSVEVGQSVEVGDALVTMIAMKMEYVIKSPTKGVVQKVLFNVGQTVDKGTTLVVVEEVESGDET